MKKTCVPLLALLLFAIASFVHGQSRARRVGQPSSSPPPATSTDSSTDSTTNTAPAPTRPPVLGGNNNGGTQSGRTAPANNGPEEVGEGDVVRVNTSLVTLPVSVMDRDGHYIPNLTKSDFRLFENGVEQPIAFFASVDKPFSVVLMLDTSGSTRFKLDEIQNAAIDFVDQLHADDQVMVISFDDKFRVLSDFTNDRRRLADAIRRTEPGSGTKLYEAVDTVINQKLSRVQGRKAVVLFTDGVDTTSRHASYDSTLREAEELDAMIFPVEFDTSHDMMGGGGGGSWPGSSRRSGGGCWGGILGGIWGPRGGGWPGGGGGRGGGPGTSPREYEMGDRYLHQLADLTGGHLYEANYDLSGAFASVADELRRQYSLGYYPKNAQAGERRHVSVRVNQPNLAVKTRDSYIFNPNSTASAQTTNQASPPVLKKKLSSDRSF